MARFKYPIHSRDYLQSILSPSVSDSLWMNQEDPNHTAIIKYSIFLGRQTKRFIRLIQNSDNFKRFNFVYVNDQY